MAQLIGRDFRDADGTVVQVARMTASRPQLEADETQHDIAPFNNPFSSLAFLLSRRPSALFMIGWCDLPHLAACSKLLGIPVIVVNASMSEKDTLRAKSDLTNRLRWSIPDRYALADPKMAQRFLEAGADPSRIAFTGPLGMWFEPQAREDKALDGKGPTVVAGSTHPQDEDVVIPAFVSLQARKPGGRLYLVPRQVGRVGDVESSLSRHGLDFVRKSQASETGTTAQVVLVDTFGELASLYALADVAFVGGTFNEDAGGHTPVEAIRCGVPVTLGPFYEQQEALVGPLAEAGLAEVVLEPGQLADAWERLAANPEVHVKASEFSAKARERAKEQLVSLLDDLAAEGVVRGRLRPRSEPSSSRLGTS